MGGAVLLLEVAERGFASRPDTLGVEASRVAKLLQQVVQVFLRFDLHEVFFAAVGVPPAYLHGLQRLFRFHAPHRSTVGAS